MKTKDPRKSGISGISHSLEKAPTKKKCRSRTCSFVDNLLNRIRNGEIQSSEKPDQVNRGVSTPLSTGALGVDPLADRGYSWVLCEPFAE
jgi:hypothetical protein